MATSAVVHLIDDDDACAAVIGVPVDDGGLAVRVYELGSRISGRAQHIATGLHRQRRPHAGDRRVGIAAPS